MQQGFIHFHAAGNHQRHLMIAVECLLQQIEDQKSGVGREDDSPHEELMEQIVHLSQAMTVEMEKFTWTLFRHAECPQSIQQFREVEGPCRQLLDANLSVVDSAHAVARKYGYAPRIAGALADISARTKLIHAQMSEYTEFTRASPKTGS